MVHSHNVRLQIQSVKPVDSLRRERQKERRITQRVTVLVAPSLPNRTLASQRLATATRATNILIAKPILVPHFHKSRM